MEEKSKILDIEAKRRARCTNKVSELCSLLYGKKNARNSRTANGASNNIAHSFFEKAPLEFIEEKSIEELAHISRTATPLLEKIQPSSDKTILHKEKSAEGLALYIVLPDHPFIVNSIAECILESEIELLNYVHPIIQYDGFRISISYVELGSISEERLAELENKLHSTLNSVVATSTDFTPMLVKAESLAKNIGRSVEERDKQSDEHWEISEFLHWLTDGGFIFLGMASWKVDGKKLQSTPSSKHGIFRIKDDYTTNLTKEVQSDALITLQKQKRIHFSKLSLESNVHRRVRLKCIMVPELDARGKVSCVNAFLGLFTSKAYSEESSSVPLIRRKLKKVLELENVVENTFDYKSIVNVVDSMPKDEALRLDVEELQSVIRTVVSTQNRNDTKVSVRYDEEKRNVTLLVVLPRDRFNTEVRHRLQRYLESLFGADRGSSEYHLDLRNKPFARLYFDIPVGDTDLAPIDITSLQEQIVILSKSWEDRLKAAIVESKSLPNSEEILAKYHGAFPERYQVGYSENQALLDITSIESLTEENPICVHMSREEDSEPEYFRLMIFSRGTRLTISKAIPILENVGLEVVEESSVKLTPSDSKTIYMNRFLVATKDKRFIEVETFERSLGSALPLIILGKAPNDPLNSLILGAELDTRAIAALRAYCYLLWQVAGFASRESIINAIASEPQAARQLWNMFEIKFDPDLGPNLESRNSRFHALLSAYQYALREVDDISKDRILRSLANLMEHTVRTNFYAGYETIALKIHSEMVDIMPRPRPLFEIFVTSPKMRGIHLRADRVSRGGIRWSDRIDDYRYEVLGLMKTQKIKNCLIVPGGAKGGFVVTEAPSDPAETRAEVENAYRSFIRALLSITDNYDKKRRIIKPKRVLSYDIDDPYLVVAADKGTATFSDIANEIAVKEFDFWLGDAFASGGSEGYDHKVYGITARGAWESVKRHFNDLGVDHTNSPFSVVGIGDMSGDVFGNGMLLSKQIRLIAAFNHKHIFIDPDPDPAISFQERKRLFETPRTQWTDYNNDLISEGGAILNRFDKEIRLSPQACTALGIELEDENSVIDGENLISHILKAPVDLLWNGGIGTYAKSSSESNADVNDGTNDQVRIDASDLQAKVVGEGGNLGLTQQARIEYSAAGGRVNTDSIDNSAGVALSDREVNYKILFQQLIRKKKINAEQRNELMREVAEDAVEAVLEQNRNHALILSVGTTRSVRSIEYFRSLIRDLSSKAYIDRSLECLPDDEELKLRANRHEGLSGPELAICLSAVKIWIKDEIASSGVLSDPLLKSFLLDYFPEKLQAKYKNEILDHPLADSIITTQVTNFVVDIVGITFFHRMKLNHAVPIETVLKCAIASELIVKTETARAPSRNFDTYLERERFVSIRSNLNRTLRDATSWLISSHGDELTLAEMVERYGKPYQELLTLDEKVMDDPHHEQFVETYRHFRKLNFEEEEAKSLALFPNVLSAFEMLWSAEQTKSKVRLAASVYSQIVVDLGMDAVFNAESTIQTTNRWENELLVSAFADLRRGVSIIATGLLRAKITERSAIQNVISQSDMLEPIQSNIRECVSKNVGIAPYSILAKQLNRFSIPSIGRRN